MSLSNLLLSKNMDVKIADFGLATQLNRPDEKHNTMCGTPNYISPEVASRASHGLPVDIWGLGCMLYTLLVGRPPFDTDGVKSTLTRVVMADYKVPDHISPAAKNLIDRLLQKNPKERIKLEEIMSHPFMNRMAPTISQSNGYTMTSQDSGVHTMTSGTSSNMARLKYRSRSEERHNIPISKPSYFNTRLSGGSSAPNTNSCYTSLLENRSSSSSKPQYLEKENCRTSSPQQFLINTYQSNKIQDTERDEYYTQTCNSKHDKPLSFPNEIIDKDNLWTNRSCEKRIDYSTQGCNFNNNQASHSDQFINVFDVRYKNKLLNCDGIIRPTAKQIDPGGFTNLESEFNNGLNLNYAQSSNIYKENQASNYKNKSDEYCYNTNLKPLHNAEEVDGSTYSGLKTAETGQINHKEALEILKPFTRPQSREMNYNHQPSVEVRHVQTSQQSKNDENTNQKSSVRTKSADRERATFNRFIGVPPFSTIRLLPTRHRTKNAILSILTSGEVVVEFLKRKGHAKEERVIDVCRISEDGLRIILYQPNQGRGVPVEDTPAPLPIHGADEIFSYESLSAKHCKKYLYAARFVNLVRAKTPKVTYYSDLAKCQLMETLEDFEVCYYDGGKVTHSESSGVCIIDREGRSVSPPSSQNSCLHTSETRTMWEHFQQCLEHCKLIENYLSQLTHDGKVFPLTIGRRPVPTNNILNRGKENISQNSTPRMYSWDISTFTSSKPQILKPHKSNQHNVETSRRVNVPGIGIATQLSSGEIQVVYADGSCIAVLSPSQGGGVNYTLGDGTFNHYSGQNELPNPLRAKLKQIPLVITHLMEATPVSAVQPSNSIRQGLR